jgi:hypothetical protein
MSTEKWNGTILIEISCNAERMGGGCAWRPRTLDSRLHREKFGSIFEKGQKKGAVKREQKGREKGQL